MNNAESLYIIYCAFFLTISVLVYSTEVCIAVTRTVPLHKPPQLTVLIVLMSVNISLLLCLPTLFLQCSSAFIHTIYCSATSARTLLVHIPTQLTVLIVLVSVYISLLQCLPTLFLQCSSAFFQ